MAWARARRQQLLVLIQTGLMTCYAGGVIFMLSRDRLLPHAFNGVAIAVIVLGAITIVLTARPGRSAARVQSANSDLAYANTPTDLPTTLTMPAPTVRSGEFWLSWSPAVGFACAWYAYEVGPGHHYLAALGFVATFAVIILVLTAVTMGPVVFARVTTLIGPDGVIIPSWRLHLAWQQIESVSVDGKLDQLQWSIARDVAVGTLIGWPHPWKWRLVRMISANGKVSIRLPHDPEVAILLSRRYIEAAQYVPPLMQS